MSCMVQLVPKLTEPRAPRDSLCLFIAYYVRVCRWISFSSGTSCGSCCSRCIRIRTNRATSGRLITWSRSRDPERVPHVTPQRAESRHVSLTTDKTNDLFYTALNSGFARVSFLCERSWLYNHACMFYCSVDILRYTSRCIDSRPRGDLDCHCSCAVTVGVRSGLCCQLANKLVT